MLWLYLYIYIILKFRYFKLATWEVKALLVTKKSEKRFLICEWRKTKFKLGGWWLPPTPPLHTSWRRVYVRSVFQCATLGLMVLTRIIFYFKLSLSGDLCSNNSYLYYHVQLESVLEVSWSWFLKIEYYFSSAWVVDVIFDVVHD